MVYNLETPDNVNSAIKSLKDQVMQRDDEYFYDFIQFNSFLVIKIQAETAEQLKVAINNIFPKAEQIDAVTRRN